MLKRYNQFTNEAVVPYDEEKYPSLHSYLDETITKALGKKNIYTSSADWGGLDVWSVKGDKFTGTFVVIDDNNAVHLMEREFNEVEEENEDTDILSCEGEEHTCLDELLKKAISLK